MKYPRILAAIRAAKWAVTPVTLQAIRDVLSARLQGHLRAMPRADFDDDGDPGEPEEMPPYDMIAPGVARVLMHGIIGRNLSGLEMMCGGCDIAQVEDNLRDALADVAVGAVVLDIDSPGGTVSGVGEFCDSIADMCAESGKPVLAYASGQCCSAAYWIACGCSGIMCSPSSDVGSIGVYMALIDESENWKQEGYKLVLVKAGEHKAAGIAGSAITPEQVALWQKEVDYIYAQFRGAVLASRPGVADETMQGQSFFGPLAQSAGLVDDVCSLEDAAETVAPTFAPVRPVDTAPQK